MFHLSVSALRLGLPLSVPCSAPPRPPARPPTTCWSVGKQVQAVRPDSPEAHYRTEAIHALIPGPSVRHLDRFRNRADADFQLAVLRQAFRGQRIKIQIMITAAVALLSTAAEICTAATAMAHGMTVVTGNLERVCFSWNRQRCRGAPFDTPRIKSAALHFTYPLESPY